MNKVESISVKYVKKIAVLVMGLLILNLLISKSLANGGGNNGTARDLGWVALGLLSLVIIYVIFYQLFINSRKILPKNDKFESRRESIKKTYLKVKKPLSFLHYLAAFIAIIILIIHGVFLIGNQNEAVIIGLIVGSCYISFV
ncbi:MAG: hypothetical protein JSV62_11405, partial [Promethearchaeota archaeon]